MLIRIYTTPAGKLVAQCINGKMVADLDQSAPCFADHVASTYGYDGIRPVDSWHSTEQYFVAYRNPSPDAAARQIAEDILTLEWSNPGVLAQEVTRLHPTHQQSLYRAIATVLRAYADQWEANRWDGRNVASVEACRDIREAGILDRPVPYI